MDAASACDYVLISGMLTEGEEGYNRFGDVAVVIATSLVGGSSASATSPGGMS